MLFFQQNHYFLRIQNHLLQRPAINRKQRFSFQLMTNGLIKRTDSEPVQPMGTIMFSPSSSGKILNTKGRFTVGDEVFYVEEGETLIMPKDIPHAVYGEERFKMQLTVSF